MECNSVRTPIASKLGQWVPESSRILRTQSHKAAMRHECTHCRGAIAAKTCYEELVIASDNPRIITTYRFCYDCCRLYDMCVHDDSWLMWEQRLATKKDVYDIPF